MIFKRLGWRKIFTALLIGAVFGGIIGVSSGRRLLWSLDQSIATVTAHTNGGHTVAFSPDGRFVASAGPEFVRIWSLNRGTKTTLNLHREFLPNDNDQTDFYGVRHLGYSADGRFLVSTSAEHDWRTKEEVSHLRAWRADTGSRHPITHELMRSIVFSGTANSRGAADGRYWIGEDNVKPGELSFYSLHEINGAPRKLGSGGWLASASFAKNASIIALGFHTGEIKVWTPKNETRPKVMSVVDSVTSMREKWARFINGTGPTTSYYTSVTDLTFTPDAQYLLSAGANGAVKIWDYKNSRLVETLTGHRSAILAMALSSNGKTLVTSSKDQTLKIWDLSHLY